MLRACMLQRLSGVASISGAHRLPLRQGFAWKPSACTASGKALQEMQHQMAAGRPQAPALCNECLSLPCKVSIWITAALLDAADAHFCL